jgi:hypothetical protein
MNLTWRFSTVWEVWPNMTTQTGKTSKISWQDLEGKVATEVLRAPKTGGDPHGEWSLVHERTVRFLLQNAVGKIWADHLTLMAAVLSARRRDVNTVDQRVREMHVRFSALVPALELETMDKWDVEMHLPMYLKGEIVAKDSQTTRYTFLRYYASVTKLIWNWLDALPEGEQEIYRRFVLPPVNPFLIEGLNKGKELREQQHQHRKAETEAVIPQFAALRPVSLSSHRQRIDAGGQGYSSDRRHQCSTFVTRQ